MSRKLVLLSGGQDSATCLAAALSTPTASVQAVVFDYGQRHYIEIDYSKRLAACAGIPIQVIDCPFLVQFNDIVHYKTEPHSEFEYDVFKVKVNNKVNCIDDNIIVNNPKIKLENIVEEI